MELFDFISLIVIPITILQFSLDYLADSQITHSETIIGLCQTLHHLVGVCQITGLMIIPFVNPSFSIILLLVMLFVITHTGYLKNKGKCWLLHYSNCLINPNKPNRKWIANMDSYVKHYIRGESWAYSDIRNNPNFNASLLINISLIVIMVKYILKH